jgi:hypothetical protein
MCRVVVREEGSCTANGGKIQMPDIMNTKQECALIMLKTVIKLYSFQVFIYIRFLS